MARQLLVLLVLLSPSLQAADLFKWTDQAGRTHYSDRPPPADARDIERKKPGGAFAQSESVSFAARTASQKHPVSLFIFEGCGEPCSKGQGLLDQRGIPYTLRNTEQDKTALKQLTGDSKVPVLVVGNQPPLTGWQENGWNTLLDAAGYPKNDPLSRFRPKPPARSAAQTQPTPAPDAAP
ncbi:MAG: glutaredoxin family protein [Methylobacterium sp.]|nr:glutaredoxin family protein [Methylobacterium sp.]